MHEIILKSILKPSKVKWVSPVGNEAHLGGGVARAVWMLKSTGLMRELGSSYRSLYGVGAIMQFRLALKDVYTNNYRKFIVHSFLSPYSVTLFLLPIRLTLIVLPHGELKFDALALKWFKKVSIIFFVRSARWLNKKIKKITIIASNFEELNLASSILGAASHNCIPDLVSRAMLLVKHRKLQRDSGLNLVNIARLVKNKGVSDFLRCVLENITAEKKSSWLDRVDAIYVFYTLDDSEEFEKVTKLICSIETLSAIEVVLYEGLNHSEISEKLAPITNKVPFISSRFESFSYALIEQLNFEYCPIVWFDNELVRDLLERKMCVKLDYLSLLTTDAGSPILENITGKAEEFLDMREKEGCSKYQDIIQQSMGLD